MFGDENMEPHDYLTENETDARSLNRRPQAARAMAREALLLDHHLEELLGAISALDSLRTDRARGRETGS